MEKPEPTVDDKTTEANYQRWHDEIDRVRTTTPETMQAHKAVTMAELFGEDDGE